MPHGSFLRLQMKKGKQHTDTASSRPTIVPLATQPTQATFTRLSDVFSSTPFDPSDPKARAEDPSSTTPPFASLGSIGGSRVGSLGWGLVSVVVDMKLEPMVEVAPEEPPEDEEAAKLGGQGVEKKTDDQGQQQQQQTASVAAV